MISDLFIFASSPSSLPRHCAAACVTALATKARLSPLSLASTYLPCGYRGHLRDQKIRRNVLEGGAPEIEMNTEGLVTLASRNDPQQTLQRLEASIASHGMTVFARIDHAAGARQAGLELRPTTVVIFGAAKAGTPLMAMSQRLGLELPLKALVWQDESGGTYVSYDDPAWLVRRFSLPEAANPIAEKMRAAIAAVTAEATA